MSLTSDQQKALDKLKVDPVAFYEKFFATEEEPTPFAYQQNIMRDIADPKYQEYAVLKGRQVGMSWTMGALVAWYCTMNEQKHALLISFNLEQAQIILNYAKTFMSRLKKKGWHDIFIEGASARNIRWKNGSEATAFGCTVPDAYNVRGQVADILIIDEATSIYDKMFPSVTPTTSNTGGKTIYLSTAGSIGSHFYRKWFEGNRADEWRRRLKNGMEIEVSPEQIPKIKSYFIPSKECPKLTPERLDAERRALGEMKFKREYEGVWAGTADQVFMHIPTFMEQHMPTTSVKPCFGGIDVGKVNDPTVLTIIESHFAPVTVMENGMKKQVEIPYRLIYGKSWERATHKEIVKDISVNIHPRFKCGLYSVDATGGYGSELLTYMVEDHLPSRGVDVKSKGKNELMLGSPAVKGLSDAFAEDLLWLNNDVNDIFSTELMFELNGYVASLMANGMYKFESVVDRDHSVDSLAHAWSALQAGTFSPFMTIRKRKT